MENDKRELQDLLEIKITRLNGVYYRLTDVYGEIEFSSDYNKIMELYDTYKNDTELQEEMYGGDDMQLKIEKETYKNGHCIDTETVVE